jgi:hypothetical protein
MSSRQTVDMELWTVRFSRVLIRRSSATRLLPPRSRGSQMPNMGFRRKIWAPVRAETGASRLGHWARTRAYGTHLRLDPSIGDAKVRGASPPGPNPVRYPPPISEPRHPVRYPPPTSGPISATDIRHRHPPPTSATDIRSDIRHRHPPPTSGPTSATDIRSDIRSDIRRRYADRP